MISRAEPLTPPWSSDLEQSTLGSLMLLSSDDQRFQETVETITAADFYRPDHRLIFKAIITLAEENQPHDWITITDQAKRFELTDNSGIGSDHLSAYIGTLVKDTPSAANIASYAKGVKNASVLRTLMTSMAELSAAAAVPDFSDKNVDALIERATEFAFQLEQGRVSGSESMAPLKPALKRVLDNIQEVIDNPDADSIPGKSTGYPELDQRFGGLEDGKLYMVAATPGMGKTTIALNIAEFVAQNNPDDMVNIFSIEMTENELAEKFLASAGRADFNKIRSPKKLLGDDEAWSRIGQGVTKLAKTNIFIEDDSHMTPRILRRKLRATMHATGKKPAVIVADFVQIMQGDKDRYANENAELDEISREMKAIAKEFNAPLILVSQLNREVTKRTNPIPVMSDLRGSGGLEQNANVILFLHRPAAIAIAEGREHELSEDEMRETMLIVGKARSGRPGVERLSFFGEHQRFDNYLPQVDAPNGGQW